MSIRDKIQSKNLYDFKLDGITIREIKNEEDLGFTTVGLKLKQEQESLVNPAGFSIGRAYLNPSDNVPCLICKEDNEPIGFILLCKWLGKGKAYSWSYFIDRKYQNMGYGTKIAKLATIILKAANIEMDIKLAVEKCNVKALELYSSIGFSKIDELDGHDLVYKF